MPGTAWSLRNISKCFICAIRIFVHSSLFPLYSFSLYAFMGARVGLRLYGGGFDQSLRLSPSRSPTQSDHWFPFGREELISFRIFSAVERFASYSGRKYCHGSTESLKLEHVVQINLHLSRFYYKAYLNKSQSFERSSLNNKRSSYEYHYLQLE
jgi:hypothetical protein